MKDAKVNPPKPGDVVGHKYTGKAYLLLYIINADAVVSEEVNPETGEPKKTTIIPIDGLFSITLAGEIFIAMGGLNGIFSQDN